MFNNPFKRKSTPVKMNAAHDDSEIRARATQEYRKEREAALKANPRYISIDIRPNRRTRRSAKYMTKAA